MKNIVLSCIILFTMSGCCTLFPNSRDCEPDNSVSDISVSPSTINLGASSNSGIVTVTNDGLVNAAVTVQSTSPFIHVNPLQQTLAPGDNSPLTVSIDRSNLATGNHIGHVRISTTDEVLNVEVRFSKEAQTRQESFTPSAITRLCPSHIAGDDDFNGHGPSVRAAASIRVSGQREIWADLTLNAKETRSNWTEADGSWSRLLWTAPTGWLITGIISSQTSRANYTDDDHELDIPSISGGSLVQRFRINGDTGGRDVGHCELDDVYMSVDFNAITVSLREN